MKVVLTYPTDTGLQEIELTGGSISFGRGSEADYRFEDDGLSRLHSTVYREAGQVWIADENSTNGTFVNGERVGYSGTPLQNGDSIRIGNYTTLKVKFVEESATVANPQIKPAPVASSAPSSSGLIKFIPIVAIALAFFVISISAVVIGIKIFVKEPPPIVQRDGDFEPTPDEPKPDDKKTPTPTATPKSADPPISNQPGGDNTKITDSPEVPNKPSNDNLPSGKKYAEMSEEERIKYIEVKLGKIAAIIGNRSSEAIPRDAIIRIKRDVDGYFRRIRSDRFDGCTGATWLKSDTATIFERASKNTPFISRAFNQQGIDSQVGIYIAMIESEHCPCLQSGTGPLGMFQFTFATAQRFFENPNGIVKGSKPPVGDDRCKPELAAVGSARYVKFLTSWFGTGPASLPLSIAAYNSGEGDMRKNLKNALDADPKLSRDFWTLIANSDRLTEQFRSENFRYPPKFFAAAIVGENPTDFGLNLQPLSSYTK
jgi:pSer/pThr/pTyr-binding forkhead associated (FHA) protein